MVLRSVIIVVNMQICMLTIVSMVCRLASLGEHLPLVLDQVALDVLQCRGFRQGVRFGGDGLFIVLEQALF